MFCQCYVFPGIPYMFSNAFQVFFLYSLCFLQYSFCFSCIHYVSTIYIPCVFPVYSMFIPQFPMMCFPRLCFGTVFPVFSPSIPCAYSTIFHDVFPRIHCIQCGFYCIPQCVFQIFPIFLLYSMFFPGNPYFSTVFPVFCILYSVWPNIHSVPRSSRNG